MLKLASLLPEIGRSSIAVLSLTAFGGLLASGCAKGQSEQDAAAVASAREAQIRAEAELKVMKELAARTPVTPADTPTPAAAEPAQTPAPSPAPAPVAPTNPLPDAGRIKGDLIGRTVSGGILKKYQFQSLDEFVAFKVVNQQQSGDVAELTSDAVMRKDAGSAKRCFSNLKATYRRTASTAPWVFSAVQANTLTCE